MPYEHAKSANSHFVFREAKNADELLQLLKLRYRVFRNSKLAALVPENRHGIDLDCYDLRAKHFGLFRVEGEEQVPVGYLRVVQDSSGSAASMVKSVATQFTSLNESIDVTPAVPFPLMKYFPDADKIASIYDNMKTRGEQLVEPSRLSLVDNIGDFRLGKHVIECAIAIYFFTYGIENAGMCCTSANGRLYEHYGFCSPEHSNKSDFLRIGNEASCVIGSSKSVPKIVRPRLSRMARAFKRNGFIWYNRQHPGIFDSNIISTTQSLPLCQSSAVA